jgi:hypothetical protein
MKLFSQDALGGIGNRLLGTDKDTAYRLLSRPGWRR